MTEPTVRRLSQEELPEVGRVVAHGMLGSLDPAVASAWATQMEPDKTHAAVAADGSIAGVTRWFESDLAVPGGHVPAGLVSAVAVLATHRRQGHLTRLMDTQLREIAEQGKAVATLVAAEWPIYGRYGYGPSVEACAWTIDTPTARLAAEPSGTTELATPADLRPHLEACHDARWAHTPGAVKRVAKVWDVVSGIEQWPGDKSDLGLHRAAIWRDASGEVRGAVAYTVDEHWVDNRPRGTANVRMLVGATAEAERELWRHLIDLDWIATVKAGNRPVDEPLPLLLTDGRAAVAKDRFDCIWSRILDVPATFGAYRRPMAGAVVVDVVDPRGFAHGRWRLELGPDGSEVSATTEQPDVRLPVAALGAAHLGGTSVTRLHRAGWLDEEAPGGVERLSHLLATPTAPWSPTTY